jgi:hypothetical protein
MTNRTVHSDVRFCLIINSFFYTKHSLTLILLSFVRVLPYLTFSYQAEVRAARINILFGQLGTFAHNMVEFGMPPT